MTTRLSLMSTIGLSVGCAVFAAAPAFALGGCSGVFAGVLPNICVESQWKYSR